METGMGLQLKKAEFISPKNALYQVLSHADLEVVLQKFFYIIISPRIGAFLNR